jgi:hypothetical protein
VRSEDATEATDLSGIERRIRARLVIFALLGVVPIAIIVQWSDLLVGGAMMAGPFPPLAASLFWSLLLIVQFVLMRMHKPAPFTRAELLVILAVWIVANMAAGRGILHPLLSSLAGPTYYARGGAIARAVPQYLPSWLAITDKGAARGFFEGHGETVPWGVWRQPFITWAAFLFPFLLANVCLCMLFERVWVRHEKLSFPLVALPLEAAAACADRDHGPLSRSALACGIAVPILLHGFGVVHAYFPGVPCISFYNDISTVVTTPPWTALKPLYVNLYPLLIGITFLAPTDVTFSVWFFLLLNKLEMVFAGAAGWSDGAVGGGMTSAPPFLEEQSAGAYIALFAILVWNARVHLGRIFAAAFGLQQRRAQPNQAPGHLADDEYRRHILPAWGLLIGIGGTLFWCSRTGIPLWFAGCFFGFYFVVALVLSRLMAEGGVTWILAPILPDKLIFGLVGSAAMPPVAITRLTLHVQHLRDTRQMISPAIMETGKLRDRSGISELWFYGMLFTGMAIALVVGTAVALPILYSHGALSLTPNSDGLMMSASVVPLTAVNQASSRLLHPIPASPGSAGGVIAGAAITIALSIMRVRLSWWPLHPLGYALTGTMQLGYANKMLCSIFLGWLFKAVTLRFGGARGYGYMRGAALGLILGDLFMGGILKVLDAALGPSGYAIF